MLFDESYTSPFNGTNFANESSLVFGAEDLADGDHQLWVFNFSDQANSINGLVCLCPINLYHWSPCRLRMPRASFHIFLSSSLCNALGRLGGGVFGSVRCAHAPVIHIAPITGRWAQLREVKESRDHRYIRRSSDLRTAFVVLRLA